MVASTPESDDGCRFAREWQWLRMTKEGKDLVVSSVEEGGSITSVTSTEVVTDESG